MMAEQLGRHWTVRQHDEHDYSPCAAKTANDQELVLPRRECALDVANRVAQQAAECNAKTVRGIPQPDSDRLLFSGIPHLSDQHAENLSVS